MNIAIGEVRYINKKPALITSGYYMGEHGVSNFWTWRYIKADGSLGKEGKGYNNGKDFEVGELIEHEVIIKVK